MSLLAQAKMLAETQKKIEAQKQADEEKRKLEEQARRYRCDFVEATIVLATTEARTELMQMMADEIKRGRSWLILSYVNYVKLRPSQGFVDAIKALDPTLHAYLTLGTTRECDDCLPTPAPAYDCVTITWVS